MILMKLNNCMQANAVTVTYTLTFLKTAIKILKSVIYY